MLHSTSEVTIMIYELKVTLKDVGTQVRRNIQIDGNTTFYDLHRVLQVAFDWENYHLHSFFVNKSNGKRMEHVEISREQQDDFTDFLGMREIYNEKEELLADWLRMPDDKLTYVYDFGDNWNHEIKFTKKLKPKQGVVYPRCTGAKNIAPDEDTRGEVLMGDVDLTHPDTSGNELTEEVNEEFRFQLKDMLSTSEQLSDDNDCWPDVLAKAKEFLRRKPWEGMSDEHIFAVTDPVTSERVYCSVLGGGGEMFGIVVYIGKEGYASLMDSLMDGEPSFAFIVQQRNLLLSFEDREDLEKSDYNLVKSYDIPFRGRKSWPSFRSYKPGYYPWVLDNDEARLMLLALEQTMQVYNELLNGLEMPDLIADESVLERVPHEENGALRFYNQVVELEDNPEVELESDVPLAISELDLKRVEKIARIPATIEFSMEYVDMPVQNEPEERPAFPILALAVERTQGLAVYQDLVTGDEGPSVWQNQFINMITAMEGIPETILVDEKTAHYLKPLVTKLKLNVDVEDELPLVRQVINMLHESLLSD